MARLDSLNILLDTTGKMKLAEAYKGVIENVQKNAISSQIKNTDLSGNPETGTVEAKRFVNATSKSYGTARSAGAGDAVEGKPVTIAIDTDKEFVEEVEEKDASLLGVNGLISRRSKNHALRMTAELDAAFFAEGKSAGTEFTPAVGTTAINAIVEEAILTLETLSNDYIDGIDRDMMSITFDAETYSAMRNYLDTVNNSNVKTDAEQFNRFHGVKCFSSNRLPSGTKFEIMMDGSIAQPVRSKAYGAERIPLSNAMGITLFFSYGTKAVTPETILYYAP